MFSIHQLDFYQRNLAQLQIRYKTVNHSIICGLLSDAGSSFYEVGAYEKSFSYFEQCLEACRKVYGEFDGHTGRAYVNAAKLSIEFGSYDTAEDHLQSALKIFQRIYESGTDTVDFVGLFNVFGILYREQCDYIKSTMYHQRALNMLRRMDRNNSNDYVRQKAGTYKHLADTCSAQSDYKQAVEYFEEAAEILKVVETQAVDMIPDSYAVEKARLLINWAKAESCLADYNRGHTLCMAAKRSLELYHGDEDTIYISEMEACRGSIYMQQGNYSSAANHYKLAVVIAKNYYESINFVPVAKYAVFYAKALEYMNNFSNSIKFYEEAVEIYCQVFQTECHPKIGHVYNDMGNYYRIVGNYSKALALHRKALAVFQESYGSDTSHVDFSTTYSALGHAYCELEDFKSSNYFNFKSLKMNEEIFLDCEYSPHFIKCYENIAHMFYSEGRYSEALNYVDEALLCIKQMKLEGGEDYCSLLHLKGKLIRIGGDAEAAIDVHKEGVSVAMKRAGGKFSAQSAIGHLNSADAYLMLGDYDKCIAHCETAVVHCEAYEKAHRIVTKEKILVLFCLSCCKYRMTSYKEARSMLAKAKKYLEKVYEQDAGSHPLMGLCFEYIGDVYNAGGCHWKSLTSHLDALNVLEQAFRENVARQDIARINGKIGNLFEKFCLHKQALKYQLESVVIWGKIYQNVDNIDLAKSLHRVGVAYSNLHDYHKAGQYHERGHQIIKNIQNTRQYTKDIIRSYTWLGSYYTSKNDHVTAIQMHTQAADICQQQLSFSRLDLACCQLELGKTYISKHEYYQARKAFTKALKNKRDFYQHEVARVEEEDEEITPTQDKLSALNCKYLPQIALVYIYVGDAWFADAQSVHHNDVNEHKRLERYEQALTNYEEALKLLRQVCLNDNHELCAAALHGAGSIYRQPQLLNTEKASELLARSLNARISVYGQGNENHPEIVKGLIELGKVQIVHGQFDQAFFSFEQASEKAKRHYGLGISLLEADAREGQGQLASAQGDHKEALEHYMQCLNIRERNFGECAKFNLPLASVYLSLADTCAALRKKQREKIYRQKYRKVTIRSSSEVPSSRTPSSLGCGVM